MIYTSYFANIKHLPLDLKPISIAAKTPAAIKIPQFKLFSPSFDILMNYKSDGDTEKYKQRFMKEILEKQSPVDVVLMLNILSAGKTPCLVCYEKPEDFCHRHLVAEWLKESGFQCEEYENNKNNDKSM